MYIETIPFTYQIGKDFKKLRTFNTGHNEIEMGLLI